MRIVAHEFRSLGSQLRNLDGQRTVVALARRGAQTVTVEKFLAQITVLGLHHERLVR